MITDSCMTQIIIGSYPICSFLGDYYLRLLLEEDENDEYSAIKRSYEFFNDLYHRFLLTPKTHMKCMCLQAMAIVYGRCYDEIGAFNDTKYIVGMLERVSKITIAFHIGITIEEN